MEYGRRVLVAAGVLLVLTAPLAVAKDLHELFDGPASPVQDMADEGQTSAEQGAADAQAQASHVQANLDDLQRQTTAGSSQGVEQARSAMDTFLLDAGHAAGTAFNAAVAAAQAAVDALWQGHDPGVDSIYRSHRDTHVTTQSAGSAAVFRMDTVAIAMMVVAGAAGSAFLWVVVLQRVFAFGSLPLLSRIAHSDIYNNNARRLIADLARENPGLCLNDVVGRTGYSRNAVSYHLFVLEKEEELVSIKDGKYRRYFPRGGKYVNGAKNVVSLLRNETSLKMAQHIVANPGTIQREICVLLGTSASAACWHAKRLEDQHIIRKERVANTVKYFPGEALAKYDLTEFGLSVAAVAPLPAP